jgi:hypothetical protein
MLVRVESRPRLSLLYFRGLSVVLLSNQHLKFSNLAVIFLLSVASTNSNFLSLSTKESQINKSKDFNHFLENNVKNLENSFKSNFIDNI